MTRRILLGLFRGLAWCFPRVLLWASATVLVTLIVQAFHRHTVQTVQPAERGITQSEAPKSYGLANFESLARAENIYYAISGTQTASLQRFSRVVSSVMVCNDDTTNEAFYVLYSDKDSADGVVAVATTSDAYIGAGKCHSWYWDRSVQSRGTGYLTISVICSSGETATVRVYGD